MHGNLLEAHDREEKVGHGLDIRTIAMIGNDEDDGIFLQCEPRLGSHGLTVPSSHAE